MIDVPPLFEESDYSPISLSASLTHFLPLILSSTLLRPSILLNWFILTCETSPPAKLKGV